MKTSKLGIRRGSIAALLAAGLVWAGVSVAQQPPSSAKPAVQAEDKPLPRKPDLPELGEPPADFGAGAAPIRNDVKPAALLAQVDADDPDAPKRPSPLITVDAKANPNDVTLAQAHAVIEAAARKAAELNTKMDIAVVDAGANLKGFVRMDGAWLGSIDISIKKAKTARYFDMNTGEIGKLSQPGGPLFGIEHSNGGLITFPGGVPLRNAQGTIIGAIGVSGSTVENDHEVAAAGAKALAPKKAEDADARVVPPASPDDVAAKPAAARTGPAAGRIDDREPSAPAPAPKRAAPPVR